MPEQPKTSLILGAAGGLAHILSHVILQNDPDAHVVGVDSRDLQRPGPEKGFEFKKIRYSRGSFEKLFREYSFQKVYYLGRFESSRPMMGLEQHVELNILGTKTILNLCHKFQVKELLVLSSFHVYGASSDNPVFMDEDWPLRASSRYPELRDVVEKDSLCTTWMWKHQQSCQTIIFRPCTIIGPTIRNTMTRYLTSELAPLCSDFIPMVQFIHEFDMAQLIAQSHELFPTGIYNVAPDETISLAQAKTLLSPKVKKLPSFLIVPLARTFSSRTWSFPPYFLDFIRYSCIIDNTLIKKYLDKFKFRYNTHETIKLLQ